MKIDSLLHDTRLVHQREFEVKRKKNKHYKFSNKEKTMTKLFLFSSVKTAFT